MTVSTSTDTVFEFFKNLKNRKSGRILKDTTEGEEDGWWKFNTPAVEAKLKLERLKPEVGIIDHMYLFVAD